MNTVNNMRGTHLLFFLVVTVISYQLNGAEGRSLIERELHPIDICIFTCDMCYKGDALVYCANECITTEAAMGPFWRRTCKFFGGEGLQSLQHHGLHETPAVADNFMP